jgi:tryptophan-rich sensory protein
VTTQSSDLQRIYEQLIEFDERDRPRFRVFSSRSDRVAVLLALAFFCLGGIAALLAWSHGIEKADLVNKILRWVALSGLAPIFGTKS